MKPRNAMVVLVLGASIVLGACGKDSESSTAALSPDAAAGKAFASTNCMGCHTTTGSRSTGPTWKGLAGSSVQLDGGQTVVADDAYLTKAIVDPGAEIVSGYPKTMASAFPAGSISDEQARQLVAYINTLK